MAPNPLTLPLAQLRAAGCRVSTVLGHYPGAGRWIYSITPPAGLSLYALADGLSDREVRADGVTVVVARDHARLIASVSANQYGPNNAPGNASLRRAAAHRLADTLSALTLKIGA
jgi:hypothetical protein